MLCYQLLHMILYQNCLFTLSIHKSFNVPRSYLTTLPTMILIILYMPKKTQARFVDFKSNIFCQFFLCVNSTKTFLLCFIFRMLFWLWTVDGVNFLVLCRNLWRLLQLSRVLSEPLETFSGTVLNLQVKPSA